jgi:hypothetical protein
MPFEMINCPRQYSPWACLMLFVWMASVLTGQTENAGTTGQSIEGSTGLILNPAPATLEVGHLRVGLFAPGKTSNLVGTEVLPYVFCLGFTERISLSSSSMTITPNELNMLQQKSYGAKANLFKVGMGELAFDVMLNEILRVTPDSTETLEKSTSYRLIGQYPMKSTMVYWNIGAKNTVESDTLRSELSPIYGVGMVLPVNEKLFGMFEFQMHNDWEATPQPQFALGIRYFPLHYFQATAAYVRRPGHRSGGSGLYLNLSFSTKSMRSIPRQTSFGSRSRGLFGYPPFTWLNEYLRKLGMSSQKGAKRPEFDEYGYPYPPSLESLEGNNQPNKRERNSSLNSQGDLRNLPMPPSLDELNAEENGEPN